MLIISVHIHHGRGILFYAMGHVTETKMAVSFRHAAEINENYLFNKRNVALNPQWIDNCQ